VLTLLSVALPSARAANSAIMIDNWVISIPPLGRLRDKLAYFEFALVYLLGGQTLRILKFMLPLTSESD
jgi:hypothetical protein